jgi:DnaJ-class molecular chaperone
MSLINPFELLGVDCKSSRDDVKKRFKDLALICHPDKGGDAEQMKMLYSGYRYVMGQIEFQEHGRTMEEELEGFKKFLGEQEDGGLPSIFEIMTDCANKKFNELWEKKDVEVIDMCYPSNYGEKMEKEPEKFSTEVIEYKEPKTIAEISFSKILDFTVNPVKDFTDYSCGAGFDYVLAHSGMMLDGKLEEKDVMKEYERLLLERKQEEKTENNNKKEFQVIFD